MLSWRQLELQFAVVLQHFFEHLILHSEGLDGHVYSRHWNQQILKHLLLWNAFVRVLEEEQQVREDILIDMRLW